MKRIFIGSKRKIELPKRGYLFIGDEVPDVPQARVFDPTKDSFNLLKALDYRKSCEIVDGFDAAFDRGDGTLTKDTGLDFIAECLEAKPKTLRQLVPIPDKGASPGHIWAYNKVRRILRSPVLSAALCNQSPPAFSFNTRSVILARINRAELGDFDALLLGLFLMAQYKGQLVIPDFGFYARDAHASLLRGDGRIIARVDTLEELPRNLRQNVLLIKDKVASGATYEDAELLAKYAGLRPDPTRDGCDYNVFVREAMA
jgi:hypothetical protein